MLLLLLVPFFTARAEANVAPTVTNIRIETQAGAVVIAYDCSDPDDDSVNIGLSAAVEADRYHIWSNIPSWRFIRLPGTIEGSVGRVGTGAGTITWRFNGSDADVQRILGQRLRIRVTADDGHPVDLASLLGAIDTATLKSDLRSIDGPRNHTDGAGRRSVARSRILRLFDTLGLYSSKQEVATSSAGIGVNLIGDQQGASGADTTIVICGHYDTVPNAPGADDNGSGTTGMMSAARALSQLHFRRSIRYIGFDMEELGLVGSMAYARAAREQGETIITALNQDMIGYTDPRPGAHVVTQAFRDRAPEAATWIEQHGGKGDFIMVFTDVVSGVVGDYWRNVAERYVPQLPSVQLVYESAISDHAGFWSSGYSGILLFDGAGWRTPYYHTPGDSIGTLDFEYMANATRVTAIMAAELAGPLHAGAADSEPFTLIPSSIRADGSAIVALEVSPNPARYMATARLLLAAPELVSATLFDATGRAVASFSDGPLEAGAHFMRIDTRAHRLAPGAYLLRVVAGRTISTARVMIVE